jgi:hypothetical protein
LIGWVVSVLGVPLIIVGIVTHIVRHGCIDETLANTDT